MANVELEGYRLSCYNEDQFEPSFYIKKPCKRSLNGLYSPNRKAIPANSIPGNNFQGVE